MPIVAQSGEIVVSYSQLCIFPAEAKEPFPNWSDQEVQQGFAWKKESIVSFETMEDTVCITAIAIEEGQPRAVEGAVRSILVPYLAPENGKVGISSILSSVLEADVAPGLCGLVFNAVPGDGDAAGEGIWTYLLALYPGYAGEAAILVQDEGYEPPAHLLLTGR